MDAIRTKFFYFTFLFLLPIVSMYIILLKRFYYIFIHVIFYSCTELENDC